MKRLFLSIFFIGSAFFTQAQLRVDIYPTEEFMIKNMLLGNESVKVWNVEFGGAHDARGVFYNQNTAIPLSDGIILTTGHAMDAQGPNKGTSYTKVNKTKGDQDLHFIAKYKTYDASWISFEFEAQQNLIQFNYVFASEEYPEYVGSSFNDVFGFFLTDLETGALTNLAVIPNTSEPITVNNVNHIKHSNFYIQNGRGNSGKVEYDGLTSVLIAFSEVTPGRKYRIKIAIADVADDRYDSGVFLQGKSFVSVDKSEFYSENQNYFNAFTDDKISVIKEQEIVQPPKKKAESKPKKTVKTKNKYAPDSLVILFDFDKPFPTAKSITNATERLKNVKLNYYNIQVVGHTDQKGSSSYNIELSKKRAENVRVWLNENYQINISTVNYKSYDQLINNQTNEIARAQNRRVVIYFKSKNK